MLLEWPLPRTVDFPLHPIFLTNVYSLCFISLMKYCFIEYAPWLYGEKIRSLVKSSSLYILTACKYKDDILLKRWEKNYHT